VFPEAPKPARGRGLGGYAGKTETMVDQPAPAPEIEPVSSPKKVPARFEDMIQQQQKY
jgi:hypothetical protein